MIWTFLFGATIVIYTTTESRMLEGSEWMPPLARIYLVVEQCRNPYREAEAPEMWNRYGCHAVKLRMLISATVSIQRFMLRAVMGCCLA